MVGVLDEATTDLLATVVIPTERTLLLALVAGDRQAPLLLRVGTHLAQVTNERRQHAAVLAGSRLSPTHNIAVYSSSFNVGTENSGCCIHSIVTSTYYDPFQKNDTLDPRSEIFSQSLSL